MVAERAMQGSRAPSLASQLLQDCVVRRLRWPPYNVPRQCTNNAIRMMTGIGTPRKNSSSERIFVLLGLTQCRRVGRVVGAFDKVHAIALASAEGGGQAGKEGAEQQGDKEPQGRPGRHFRGAVGRLPGVVDGGVDVLAGFAVDLVDPLFRLGLREIGAGK